MTSNDLKTPQVVSDAETTKNRTTDKKRKLKGGSVHEIDEINDEYLDESIRYNNNQ